MNEARNIGIVLDQLPPMVSEVILVDGGSTDETVAVARTHRPDVIVVDQHSPGKGAAMVTGALEATSDIIIFLDGDCSMNPAEIPSMVEALLGGADVAKGSRGMTGGGSQDFTWIRKLGNSILTVVANVAFRVRWTDFAYGYFAFWSDIQGVLDFEGVLESNEHPLHTSTGQRHRPKKLGHGFEIEALVFCRAARRNLNVVEVPSHEDLRRHGTSNLLALQDGFRVALTLVVERFGKRTTMTPDRSRRPSA